MDTSVMSCTRADLAANAEIGTVINVEDAKMMEKCIAESGDKVIPGDSINSESLRLHSATTVESDAALNCLPVVDLASPLEELLRAIEKACEWGFFHIINHGVDPNLLKKMSSQSQEFFSLPMEEKTRCSTPQKVEGPIHFAAGSRGDWRDVLKIICAPASAVAVDYWPIHPLGYKETIKQYATEQQPLVKRLLEIISESLGLERDYIPNECRDPRVLLAINHYPPSPDPSLTRGLREHSDPNTITILLQDHVAGLQVYKDGIWLDVKPMENALAVNLGDHLQILSNGRYASCLHRVVNNKTHPRTSVSLFIAPAHTADVKPAPALLDEQQPRQYIEFTYSKFLKNFYDNGGPNKKSIPSQFQGCTFYKD